MKNKKNVFMFIILLVLFSYQLANKLDKNKNNFIKNSMFLQSTQSQSNSTEYNIVNPYEDNQSWDKYHYQKNITCTEKNCFLPYGVCTNSATCQCTLKYASYQKTTDNTTSDEIQKTYCTYKRKEQLTAFLLEMFLPLGAGHFYSGRILSGILKLILFLAPIVVFIFFCVGVSISKTDDEATCVGICTIFSNCALFCAVITWQMADIVLYAINLYDDGNGVPLKHW
jgi:TM2 domain-containing membrane protein YozV